MNRSCAPPSPLATQLRRAARPAPRIHVVQVPAVVGLFRPSSSSPPSVLSGLSPSRSSRSSRTSSPTSAATTTSPTSSRPRSRRSSSITPPSVALDDPPGARALLRRPRRAICADRIEYAEPSPRWKNSAPCRRPTSPSPPAAARRFAPPPHPPPPRRPRIPPAPLALPPRCRRGRRVHRIGRVLIERASEARRRVLQGKARRDRK